MMAGKRQIEKVGEAQKPMAMHPKKFAFWLFLLTVVMVFAALTSAYIVRRADGNWLEFSLPDTFWINTAIIVLSSITMQWAYFAAKKDNLDQLKLALLITSLAGVAFLLGQLMAWGNLVEIRVFFAGAESNPAGSFLYVLTGLHGLHLVSALIFLVVVLINSLKLKIHSKNMLQIELCTTYWHFLGALWIYLFGFLLLYN
ncbi:MAG: heme-copper oxidase subunit III [Cytophagaceae bacterium]